MFKWVKGDLIGKGAVRPSPLLPLPLSFAPLTQSLSLSQYGRVYLGLNPNMGDMFAVKQVEKPQNAADKADDRQTLTINALKSEIQLLKDLDHPNVVQYLGQRFSTRDVPCPRLTADSATTQALRSRTSTSPSSSNTFQEVRSRHPPPLNARADVHVRAAGSLGSVFKKYGKLQEGEVRWFSRQILDGLAYLHDRGILHRVRLPAHHLLTREAATDASRRRAQDLKGDNILVDPHANGVCKISDFGISKQSSESIPVPLRSALRADGGVIYTSRRRLLERQRDASPRLRLLSVPSTSAPS